MYKVVVLQPGYSIVEEDGSMRANGTSTLVVSNNQWNVRSIWEFLSDWGGLGGDGGHPLTLGQGASPSCPCQGGTETRRCDPPCKVLLLTCSSVDLLLFDRFAHMGTLTM